MKSREARRVETSAKKLAQTYYQDKRWKIVREEKLRLNPVCEQCEAAGRTRSAEEVHHMIPFMSAKSAMYRDRLAFDIDNLESLCIECHKQQHHS